MFREELTGPEYAQRYIDMVESQSIETKLDSMVLEVTKDKVVTASNRTDGIFQVKANAIVLAMGCR
jgi:sarcosine oxidase subunit alpha